MDCAYTVDDRIDGRKDFYKLQNLAEELRAALGVPIRRMTLNDSCTEEYEILDTRLRISYSGSYDPSIEMNDAHIRSISIRMTNPQHGIQELVEAIIFKHHRANARQEESNVSFRRRGAELVIK